MNEASVNQLYRSTVKAFPHTQARQHLVYTIEMKDVKYTPFIGVSTLLVRGTAINEDRSYNPLVLLKKIKYVEEKDDALASVRVQGKTYYFETPSKRKNDILVRCQCEDLKWRGQHELKLARSLYGNDRKPYIGQGLWEANPSGLPIMCKHILKLLEYLEQFGILIT